MNNSTGNTRCTTGLCNFRWYHLLLFSFDHWQNVKNTLRILSFYSTLSIEIHRHCFTLVKYQNTSWYLLILGVFFRSFPRSFARLFVCRLFKNHCRIVRFFVLIRTLYDKIRFWVTKRSKILTSKCLHSSTRIGLYTNR